MSMFSSGSSLPARTMTRSLLQLSRQLSQADDDLVDQQRLAGRDVVGHDLQLQRAAGPGGVVDDDPLPDHPGQGGRGRLRDLPAVAPDQPQGDPLARGGRAHPGRGHIALAPLDRGDGLGQGQADRGRRRAAAPHRRARSRGPALRLLAGVGLADRRPAAQVLLEAPVDDEVAERPCPGGREVGPPWALLAGASPAAAAGGLGASLAELISQVARIPANTTEAMTTAMAAPAGPPRERRGAASWRPRGRSGYSSRGPDAGRARRTSASPI